MAESFQCVKGAGKLVPVDEHARECIAKIGDGEYVLATVRRMRNPQFHRKFMALCRLAFQQWNPTEQAIAGMPAKKSFENFRKELTIAAGYYDIHAGLDGPRLEAQSIAWGNMGEDTFTELYESVVDVLARGILPGLTVAQANALSEQVIAEGF